MNDIAALTEVLPESLEAGTLARELTAAFRSMVEYEKEQLRRKAVEQAAAMVDRFNRIFLRTLRALRDLRRYSPTVVVQNAEQVNVGRRQVNVTGHTGA
jgi:hypothetical protein